MIWNLFGHHRAVASTIIESHCCCCAAVVGDVLTTTSTAAAVNWRWCNFLVKRVKCQRCILMLLGNLNAAELASVPLSCHDAVASSKPFLNLNLICSYRPIQEHQGSSEWSDGVHQRWHHPGWSRIRKWSPRPKSHPRHHPRHCGGVSSLPRAALQKEPPVTCLQLPQERHSGWLIGKSRIECYKGL